MRDQYARSVVRAFGGFVGRGGKRRSPGDAFADELGGWHCSGAASAADGCMCVHDAGGLCHRDAGRRLVLLFNQIVKKEDLSALC